MNAYKPTPPISPQQPISPVRKQVPRIIRQFAWKLLGSAFAGTIIGTLTRQLIEIDGCFIHTTPEYVHRSVVAELFWGTYEWPERTLFKTYIPQNLPVLDLGSNIGVLASMAARSRTSIREVVCVEANPQLIPLLTQNLQVNAACSHIQVINTAVVADAKIPVFLLQSEKSYSGRLATQPNFAGPYPRQTTTSFVELLTRLGWDSYCLLCDIEGAEHGIISSPAGILAGCEWLLVEMHDWTIDGAGSGWRDRSISLLQDRHGMVLLDQIESTYIFHRSLPISRGDATLH